MTKTDFDDPHLAPIMATCADCHESQQVYGYILVQDGQITRTRPLCYECWWARQVKARARMGKNEKAT